MGGAYESGARETETTAAEGLDPGLMFVSRQWARLTAEQRLRIVEIATSAALEPVALRVDPHSGRDGSSRRSGKTKFRRNGSPPVRRPG